MTSDEGNGRDVTATSDAVEPAETASTAPVRAHTHLVRRRKFWAFSGGALLSVVAVLLFAVVWYYSSEIQAGAFEIDHTEDEFDLRVEELDGTHITLSFSDPDSKPNKPGVFGLETEFETYGQVSQVVGEDGDTVTRVFEPIVLGTGLGNRVRIDRAAFPENPGQAFRFSYSEVEYDSPLGPMPAWFVPAADGENSTWAIMTHGRTADRTETLRALKIAHDAGLPVLSISYRNDVGVAQDPSGEYGFGTTEWPDLEAAVEYALANGAESVVLFGFSMGGSLTVKFMAESELSNRVSGLVLDAPMLNLTNALELAGQQRGLPLWLPWLAANLSRVRFGTDWAAMDVRDEVLGLDLPILLFHGTGDETVPVSMSDAIAEKAGPNLTYVRVEGAEHVGAWNVAPDLYERSVRFWLSEVVNRP